MEEYSVSLIMPAYNSERYISRAIDSVLAQTLPVDEIIVVDDGSQDNTLEVLSGYGDKIKVIKQANGGASVARNTGIAAASSQWIAFLDSDDEWLPDKNRLQIELLKRNSDLKWISSNHIRCLCNSNIQRVHHCEKKADILLCGKEYFSDFFDAFIAQTYGNASNIMIKWNVFDEVGMFPIGQKNVNDMDMWWRTGLKYPELGFVNQPLSIYHLDIPDSLTHTAKKWDQYIDMVNRTVMLADDCGRLDKFLPSAKYMVYRWMRSMLFHRKHAQGLKLMYNEFKNWYSPWLRIMFSLAMVSPVFTEKCCKIVSAASRLTKLRKALVADVNIEK